MNLTKPLSRKAQKLIAGLVLLSGIAIYLAYDRLAEFRAWRDPLSMRSVKVLWARSQAGMLEDYDLDAVRAWLEVWPELRPWEQKICRAVLAVVIEYPPFINPPPRGPELAVDYNRPGDITKTSAELRAFVEQSPWSKWANENWGAIEPWLRANVDRLQVNEGRDRFTIPAGDSLNPPQPGSGN